MDYGVQGEAAAKPLAVAIIVRPWEARPRSRHGSCLHWRLHA